MRKIFQTLRLRFDPEPDVCPTAAFEPDELAWPRIVRRAFSDPRVPHESTGVHGRGTEEVKTNDVSGRVQVGEVGFTIEFGRPGVGARFRDIQKMCYRAGASRRRVRKEESRHVADERRFHAAPSAKTFWTKRCFPRSSRSKCPVERAEEIIRLVWDVEKQIDTVVALGVGVRCDQDGEENVVAPILEKTRL